MENWNRVVQMAHFVANRCHTPTKGSQGESNCPVVSNRKWNHQRHFYRSFHAKTLDRLSVTRNGWIDGLYERLRSEGAVAQKHRDTASDIWPIRESYLSLLTDIVGGKEEVESIRERRDALQASLAAIYKARLTRMGKLMERRKKRSSETRSTSFRTRKSTNFCLVPYVLPKERLNGTQNGQPKFSTSGILTILASLHFGHLFICR